MTKKKQVSTNQLARLIKHGFDGVDSGFKSVAERFNTVDERFNQIDAQFKTVNHRLDHLEEGVADLRVKVKKGFAGMPSRKEFDDFRRLVERRHRVFAAKLGLSLAKIDSEG